MHRLAKKHWFNDFGAYRPFVPQDHRQPKTNLDQVALLPIMPTMTETE